jgi:uncharacterized protein (TIGR03067 family)
MKTLLYLCIAVAVSLTTLADEKSDDSKSLEGIWIPVKAELGGQPMPDTVLKTITLKLQRDAYEVTVKDEGSDSGTWKIDLSTRPKRLTIKSVKGANAGKTFPAIYELKADTLRVCYDLSGKEHPKEFKTSKGTALYVVTYNRKKTS